MAERWSVTEVVTIAGVVFTLVGGMLVFASNATDRIALMEERITRLQHDVDRIEAGDPMVSARLTQQRADIDKLEHRMDVLQGADK